MAKALAGGQHGAASQSYVYTRLSDLTTSSNRVNIWAVVKFFKEPQRSKGSDYFQSLSIVDESLDPRDGNAKLVCVFFNADIKQLPSIHRVGDVIRLHRVNVQPARDVKEIAPGSHPLSKLQAMSTYGFSWVVVDGDVNADLKPRSCSNEITWTEADKSRARELRNWYSRNHITSPPSSSNLPLLPRSPSPLKQPSTQLPASNSQTSDVKWIENVSLNNYFNAPVLVLGVGVKSNDRCVLYVTDGSMPSKRQSQNLPPFAQIDPSELSSLKIDHDLFDTFGNYMVPVVIYDDHCPTAQSLKPGDVVMLRNLHVVQSKFQTLIPQLSSVFGVRLHPVDLVLHGKTHFGRGLHKMNNNEPLARQLEKRVEDLRKAHAEAEEMDHVDVAVRTVDQSLGPFAELLQTKSRHLISRTPSPSSTPPRRLSPRRRTPMGSPRDETPAKVAKTSNQPEESMSENDDEWEIVTMRDVATQTNFQ